MWGKNKRFRVLRSISLIGLLFLADTNCFAANPNDADINIPTDLDSILKPEQKSRLSLDGYLKNETAFRFNEPRSFTKLRNVLSLTSQLDLGQWARLYASGWAYYDAVYTLIDYETISARPERESSNVLTFIERLQKDRDDKRAEEREVYLDLYLPHTDIRLGKQFVIWGVLEGIRVVDELNPIDFHELILPELLDYRIPLWTAKVSFYTDESRADFVWIPDLRFHQPAPSGSEWELFQVLPQTTQPTNFNPYYSEFGVRFGRRMYDTDFTLSYFYTWDDYPVTFRIIDRSVVTSSSPQVSLPILPTYTRMSVYGATFSREIGGNILKGEFAYVTDKYFAIVDRYEDGFLVSDGDIKRNHIRWGIGYDFSFWGMDFGPAIAQWKILNYESDILTHEYDTTFNLFVRKPLLKRSAVFTMLMIGLLEFREIYVKPKMTFNMTDHFNITMGLDYFFGSQTSFGRAFSADDPGGLTDVEQRAQFIGNFSSNRRVFVEFKYNF